MKISELEQEIKKIGLKYERDNNFNAVFLQVWTPYSDKSGFKLDDGKWYEQNTLSKEKVDWLNSKYEKLLVILKKNDIKIARTDYIENGVMSSLLIYIKNKSDFSLPKDFEIETDINTSRMGYVNYDRVIPTNTGYIHDVPVFGDVRLRKHENELIIQNTPAILKMYNKKQNLEWVSDYVIYQNNIKPLEEAVKSGAIDPRDVVEKLFSNRTFITEIKDVQVKRVVSFLSKIPMEEVDITKAGRNFTLIPRIIMKTPSIFNNILKNWGFFKTTGELILTDIIKEKNLSAFKKFTNMKDASDYASDDWLFFQQPILVNFCSRDSKLLNVLIKKDWVRIGSADLNNIIGFIGNNLNDVSDDVFKIIIKEFFENNSNHSEFISKMFKEFEHRDFHDSIISRDITKIMIENSKPENINVKDFMIHNGIIMRYLEDYDDEHSIKQLFLGDGDFIDYLVDIDKAEYLPSDVTDIFVF